MKLTINKTKSDKVINFLLLIGFLYFSYFSIKYLQPPKIIIVNKSGYSINNLSLQGSGNNLKIGTLKIDESLTIKPEIKGETTLDVIFTLKEESFIKENMVYIHEYSQGYNTQIIISQDGKTNSKLKRN